MALYMRSCNQVRFEDIRPEDVAPSLAGGHGRIDFLIKAEQIAIEIKKTRPSLRVKELRDQLIVDKEIYRTHPHYRTYILSKRSGKVLLFGIKS